MSMLSLEDLFDVSDYKTEKKGEKKNASKGGRKETEKKVVRRMIKRVSAIPFPSASGPAIFGAIC